MTYYYQEKGEGVPQARSWQERIARVYANVWLNENDDNTGSRSAIAWCLLTISAIQIWEAVNNTADVTAMVYAIHLAWLCVETYCGVMAFRGAAICAAQPSLLLVLIAIGSLAHG